MHSPQDLVRLGDAGGLDGAGPDGAADGGPLKKAFARSEELRLLAARRAEAPELRALVSHELFPMLLWETLALRGSLFEQTLDPSRQDAACRELLCCVRRRGHATKVLGNDLALDAAVWGELCCVRSLATAMAAPLEQERGLRERVARTYGGADLRRLDGTATATPGARSSAGESSASARTDSSAGGDLHPPTSPTPPPPPPTPPPTPKTPRTPRTPEDRHPLPLPGSSDLKVHLGGARITFKDTVICHLERWFIRNIPDPYPSVGEKEALADCTGLDVFQIQNWFCNTRKRRYFPIAEGRRVPRSDFEKRMQRAVARAGRAHPPGGDGQSPPRRSPRRSARHAAAPPDSPRATDGRPAGPGREGRDQRAARADGPWSPARAAVEVRPSTPITVAAVESLLRIYGGAASRPENPPGTPAVTSPKGGPEHGVDPLP